MKYLITSGSCYTFGPNETWAKYLSYYLKAVLINVGTAGYSNGIIKRKALYTCEQFILKKKDTSKLLVGIQWAEVIRSEIFFSKFLSNENTWQTKLTKNPDEEKGFWNLLHPYYKDSVSKNYYDKLYDPINSLIQTYENIIQAQLYFEKNKINYFMMCVHDDIIENEYINDINVKWLYNQIDFSKFVEMTSMYEWYKNKSNLEFTDHDLKYPKLRHPTYQQHKLYTDLVIIPFLREKNLIK